MMFAKRIGGGEAHKPAEVAARKTGESFKPADNNGYKSGDGRKPVRNNNYQHRNTYRGKRRPHTPEDSLIDAANGR
jgi:hypothetical protein